MHISIAHYIAKETPEERLQLHILGPLNLQGYSISDGNGHTYTFKNQQVSKGDKIILYTGKGKDYAIPPDEEDELSETVYIYYWGIDTSSWNAGSGSLSVTDGADIDVYTLDELIYIAPEQH